MRLRRSAKDFSIRARFYKVDVVFLTEGGSPPTDNSSKITFDHEQFDDEVFWKSVLQRCGFKKRFKCKAVGSKATLKKYNDEINKGRIENLCVAVDTDLDDLYQGKIESAYILYTYGYSWESDIFSKDLLFDYMKNLTSDHGDINDVRDKVKQFYNEFTETACEIMADEFRFRKLGVGFVTKLNWAQYIRNNDDGVKIDSRKIRERSTSLKQGITDKNWNKFSVPKSRLFARYIYGKLVEEFTYLLFLYIENLILNSSRKSTKSEFKELFYRIFERANNLDSLDYYSKQVQKLNRIFDD